MKKYCLLFILFFITLTVQNVWSQIVINEIMFNPAGDEPEWIELFNNSSDITYNDSLKIKDVARQYTFFAGNFLPKHYLVLVKDTALLLTYRTIPDSAGLLETKLPGMNNDKDSLYLLDINNNIIDNFFYNGNWANKGFSLERTSPLLSADNKSSLKQSIDPDSATCGRGNSVLSSITDTLPKSDEVELSPNPFSPNSTNGKNLCNILLKFPKEYISLKITCYDMNGAVIRTIAENPDKFTPGVYTYIWDGMNEHGFPVQSGIYPLIIEYKEVGSDNVIVKKVLSVVGS